MSFLKLDTRPTAAPVMPEGQYKLVCTNASYTLKNKDTGITQANVKGLLCSFQFKANGKTGELVHNFNLFHSDDQVRRIGIEDFGTMCKAMGFVIDAASGYALNAAGEVVEPRDIKGKTANAHIIVKPHWQNPENWQNVVKSWVMPKDTKKNNIGDAIVAMTAAITAEQDNIVKSWDMPKDTSNQVDDYVEDIPF